MNFKSPFKYWPEEGHPSYGRVPSQLQGSIMSNDYHTIGTKSPRKRKFPISLYVQIPLSANAYNHPNISIGTGDDPQLRLFKKIE